MEYCCSSKCHRIECDFRCVLALLSKHVIGFAGDSESIYIVLFHTQVFNIGKMLKKPFHKVEPHHCRPIVKSTFETSNRNVKKRFTTVAQSSAPPNNSEKGIRSVLVSGFTFSGLLFSDVFTVHIELYS